MAEWTTFAGLAGAVLVLILVLAHLTKTVVTEPATGGPSLDQPTPTRKRTDEDSDESESIPGPPGPVTGPLGEPVEGNATGGEQGPPADTTRDAGTHNERLEPELSTGALLANVAITHGLFCALLVGAAWYAEIPLGALGIERTAESVGLPAVGLGLALGVGLYLLNVLGVIGARRFDVEHSDELREMLAPSTVAGWIVLLVVVLPIIALFEEFLFRAALVGALSAGFGLSPWLLAVASSVAFAVGHGLQGTAGILVTGTLGLLLAVAFVATGSLLVVVVAHYVVNALEFVVHEGVRVEWTSEDEPPSG